MSDTLLALLLSPQGNLDATGINRFVDAINTNKRSNARDTRILQNDAHRLLLTLGHRFERKVLRRLRDHLNQTRILSGKKTFGDRQIKQPSQHKGAQRHKERQGLMPQHDFQAASITPNQRLDPTVGLTGDPAVLLRIARTQKARAHHRREGERNNQR